MAWNSGEPSATLSVLDRLIDEDPTNPYEVALTRPETVQRLKASLRRDLEWLLNARRIAIEPPAGLREINRSAYMFGLPDLMSFSLGSEKDRTRLLRTLQTTLRIFEPRLANVRVVPLDANDPKRQSLSFRIEGMLIMDPAPEHVTFDTVLDVPTGEYNVKGEPNAG